MTILSSSNVLLASKVNRPLGEILIEAGLISASQIEIALQQQAEKKMRIGEILASHNWIEQKTADFFVEHWPKILKAKQKRPLVYYFLQAGLLNKKQIDNLIYEQQQLGSKIRFHRLVVEQGYIKQITVDFFLANVFGIYNSNVFSFAKPYEILSKYNRGQVNFQRTELSKTPMVGVTLKKVYLDGSNMIEANLNSCNLSYSSLIQVNLTHANLMKAILTEVNLARACLVQTNLREAHLKQTNFKKANLQGADLRNAYLFQASFAGANLKQAKLPQEYSYDIYYDSQTCFNPDFAPRKAGWVMIN